MADRDAIARCLEAALSTGGDFAEVFLEDKDELNIKCAQQVISGVTTVGIHGAGIHLLRGERAVYVYTSDTSAASLLRAARQAAELLGRGEQLQVPRIAFTERTIPTPNPVAVYPGEVPHAHKKAILRQADAAARAASPGIRHLAIDLFDTDQRVTIANSEGLLTGDRRVTARLRMQATVEDAGRAQSAWHDYTRPMGFEAFARQEDYERFARDVILDLREAMRAASAPSCVVPVVLEAGCGTLWHEACGHMLEAIAIANNASPFVGLLGRQIASEKVTLVDDGSIPGLYGSCAIDDEGAPTRKNVLIERGVLRGYLCDRHNGRRIGMDSTGSGRRQSYAFAPSSRMTNTYLDAGEDDEEAMIREIPEGLLVKRLGGGNSGRSFSIAVSEGYWIKNGQIDRRVKGLNLNGSGAEIIRKVDRVGRVNRHEESGGFCGASSGLCPVTSFQPRMRISEMTIGGEG